jgi:hypothetical protein
MTLPSMAAISSMSLPSMYLHSNHHVDWTQTFPSPLTTTSTMSPYLNLGKCEPRKCGPQSCKCHQPVMAELVS